ncbi:hypothetical protein A7985_03510 [Pseudoalteromonas luteoviolacea]|uniref:Uncharacterized protein n=1 Tax=Pseudoalteromonas luteoviolacea TaxID=43657 RepID=A0A1C0TUX9_9GAMM|nr:hypothetical protein [Pseudoalteromonas luteoviolacea]OCQ23034.1 hypothetical protein A7985_03510 [Pseudoalteromonas luteoviolacea]
MRPLIALLCVASSDGLAFEETLDFSERVIIPEVKTVSVSNYTRTQFDEAQTLRSNSVGAGNIGKIYSILTPDEKIQYKYEKGILSTTVTFDQYYTVSAPVKKSRKNTTQYIFWGK